MQYAALHIVPGFSRVFEDDGFTYFREVTGPFRYFVIRVNHHIYKMVSAGYVRSPRNGNTFIFIRFHIHMSSSSNFNISLVLRTNKIGAVHIKTYVHTTVFQA